jgi:hypothetical protein
VVVSVEPAPTVIDLEDPVAINTFRFPPYVLRNPTHLHYLPTQELLDMVFNHPANTQGQKAWGVKVPSVRTLRVPGYSPTQFVFMLQPNQRRLPAVRLESWQIEFEFLDQGGSPVTAQTGSIDWTRPRFRVTPTRGTPPTSPVPAYATRPGATPFLPQQWYHATIAFV